MNPETAGRADAGDTGAPGWWSRSQPWSSGHWSLELRGDELADIRFRRRLLLRGVRAVVRDADWGTVPTRVVDAEPGESQLTVRLAMEGLGLSVHGALTAVVQGDALEIRWRAVSAHAAETNRTGLVLLHPPTVAGGPLRVRHPDRTTTMMRFPIDISPHQPAFDISGMDWSFDGGEARLSLSGDVFEMEDQRNWTDASFKTYSRPLALPFPYSLAEGEVLQQTARLEATEPGAATVARANRIELAEAGAFPSIGVGASTAPDPAPAGASGAAFLLVELDLATTNWRAALQRAARSGAPLDVRVVADPGADLAAVAEALAGRRILRVAIYDHADSITLPALRNDLREALAAHGLSAPLIGGSRSHFTELNRGAAVIPDDLDGLAFALTPLFHTLDTEQLVESVPMQRLAASQAARMAAGRGVHIGPVTLRPRFNNVATSPQPSPTGTDLSSGYGPQFTGGDDPRIDAEQLRAWTVASAAALAVPCVASLCYFEEWGPRGIRDSTGRTRPVAEVLGWLTERSGSTLLAGESPDGQLWALGGMRGGAAVVLAANLGREPRALTVATPVGDADVLLEPGGATRIPLGG